MQKIYLVFLDEHDQEEDELVAVFDQWELAESFSDRHPRFHKRYRIQEKELNPYFEKTDQYTYEVIIFPEEENRKDLISKTRDFSSESQIYRKPYFKMDDSFVMHMFADDRNQAQKIARAKYQQLVDSGVWEDMEDQEDEYDSEDDDGE